MGKAFHWFVLIVGLALLSGCAVGQSINYVKPIPKINFTGIKTVAAGVHDQRPYVKNFEKNPSYVGTFRGGFGNPWNVETQTGNPISEDMLQGISHALMEAGFTVTPLHILVNDTSNSIMAKFKRSGANRLALVTLHEWRSDTYMNTSLYYNAVLHILDLKGNVLAESKIFGEQDLGGSALNPPGHAKEEVPKAYKDQIGKLFNSPNVKAALR